MPLGANADDFPLGKLTVAVFGAGTGEAVVLGFPDGSYAVVDGAAEGPNDPVLPLLQDLRQNGRGPCRFACLTHPHEDHYRGLERVIQEFNPDEIWFAGAEHPRMFKPLWSGLRRQAAARDEAASHDADAGVRPAAAALRALIDLLIERTSQGTRQVYSVGERQVHLEYLTGGSTLLRVRTLLPTTTSRLRALRRLGSKDVGPVIAYDCEDVETHDRHINEISSVLLIEWGESRVLLGADAEAGNGRWGWGNVELPAHLNLVKAPHHGSSGAFHAERWAGLNIDTTIMTPYQHATGKQPPQREGLALYRRISKEVYLTHPPHWYTAPKASPLIRSAMGPPASVHHSAVVAVLDSDGSPPKITLHGAALQYPG